MLSLASRNAINASMHEIMQLYVHSVLKVIKPI